jgi:hypothetical protein
MSSLTRSSPADFGVYEKWCERRRPLLAYGYLGKFLRDLRELEKVGGPRLEVKARGTQNAVWLEGARYKFISDLVRHLRSRFPDDLLHPIQRPWLPRGGRLATGLPTAPRCPRPGLL